MQACTTAPHSANRPRGVGLRHIAEGIEAFFIGLEFEAQREIEVRGGMQGPIRGRQRPWAWALEEIEGERQGSAR